jgi:hypothetical protein
MYESMWTPCINAAHDYTRFLVCTDSLNVDACQGGSSSTKRSLEFELEAERSRVRRRQGPSCFCQLLFFWDITLCSPLKVNRHFGGTCRLHLQGRRISQARNQPGSACHLLSRWLLAWLILRLSRRRRCVPPKRRLSFNGLHGIMSQEIELFLSRTRFRYSGLLGFWTLFIVQYSKKHDVSDTGCVSVLR